MEAQRTYWSERQGRGPKLALLTLDELKRQLFSALDDLTENEYFQEVFGKDCPDDADAVGTAGPDLDAWWFRQIRREQVWPCSKFGENYDEDTLFDVIEVLHDVASEGRNGSYHDYGGCGYHYSEFDSAAGQAQLRARLNPILAEYETSLRLNDRGELIELAGDFDRLLDKPMPETADHDLVARVEGAKETFTRRRSTRVERRAAVRELADVLEGLRETVKEKMLSKDEKALFHLANGFSIRHNGRDQKGDYDDATWLSWAFWVYLATIQAITRVIERDEDERT
jgi:hypothetical protein